MRACLRLIAGSLMTRSQLAASRPIKHGNLLIVWSFVCPATLIVTRIFGSASSRFVVEKISSNSVAESSLFFSRIGVSKESTFTGLIAGDTGITGLSKSVRTVVAASESSTFCFGCCTGSGFGAIGVTCTTFLTCGFLVVPTSFPSAST